MKRVFKRSELEGVTGYIDTIGTIRLFPLTMAVRKYDVTITSHTAEDCRRMKDSTLFGQPLIDAIRNLGYEVVEDVAEQPKPRTYTAREWLEKSLPNGGEWYTGNSPAWDYLWWQHAGDSGGTAFYKHTGGVVSGGRFGDSSTIIPRSTAIDLMVKAIEAGDQPAQPDPYAHLPHGGWWVHYKDRLLHWPDHDTAATQYSLDGKPDMGAYISVPWATWLNSGHVWRDTPTSSAILRYEAIAIIEKHKAEQAQPAPTFKVGDRVQVDMDGNEWHQQIGVVKRTQSSVADVQLSHSTSEAFPFSYLRPAPAEQKEAAKFGGPHDAEAAKWAEERGYRVVGWQAPKTNDRYIANSDLESRSRWHIDDAKSNWSMAGHERYILSPKEAAKVDTLAALVDAASGITNKVRATEIANAIDAHITARMEGK